MNVVEKDQIMNKNMSEKDISIEKTRKILDDMIIMEFIVNEKIYMCCECNERCLFSENDINVQKEDFCIFTGNKIKYRETRKAYHRSDKRLEYLIRGSYLSLSIKNIYGYGKYLYEVLIVEDHYETERKNKTFPGPLIQTVFVKGNCSCFTKNEILEYEAVANCNIPVTEFINMRNFK
jgi:hypothetical protein